jgi:hypothetical protein
MGKGGQVRGHQGRVIGMTPAQIFRTARYASRRALEEGNQ